MEQLLKVLDTNENVTALPFEDHRDWDSFLDSLYVGMPASAVKKNHNFTVEVDKPTTTSMTIQRTVLEGDQQYTKTYEMANRQLTIVERMTLIKEIPHLLEKPGIKKITQVELVSKWGRYIPDEYKKGILPDDDLSDKDLKSFNKERWHQKLKTKTKQAVQEDHNARQFQQQQEKIDQLSEIELQDLQDEESNLHMLEKEIQRIELDRG